MVNVYGVEDIGAVEWEYVAEGRHHVIVRDKHSKPPHVVLRFKKRIETHAHEIALSADLGSEAPYVRRFLSPQYRPLRNCRKVAVPSHVIAAIDVRYVLMYWRDACCCREHSRLSLLDRLRVVTLSRIYNDRPVGRRQDNLCVRCQSALVEPDLSRLWQFGEHRMWHRECDDISAGGLVVEIKPKNNRIIHSPFYSGDSLLKHSLGRYSLLQHYKSIRSSAGQNMPWGVFDHMSGYEPQMMFSGNKKDIQTALRALLENPQNNLRVSVDGQHVFGWDLASNKQALCDHLVHIFRSPSCDQALDTLVETLSSILHYEDLLRQIHYLQSFDLFNVEGAAAVFEHLVAITGSETHAFEHVRQFDGFDEIDIDGALELLRERLQCETWRCPQHAKHAQQMREEAMHQLRSLTVDECVLALQLWLHALTISDCSIMIALQPQFEVACDGVEVNQCRTSSTDRPGAVPLQVSWDGTTYDVVHFTLGVVDVELKAFEKIVSKAVDDAEICSVVAAALKK